MTRLFLLTVTTLFAVILGFAIAALAWVSVGQAATIPAPGAVVVPVAAPGPAPGRFAGKLYLVAEEKGGCGPQAPAGSSCKMEDCSGRTCWAVVRPFSYRTHAGDLITVPAGMTTDLASVPRFAWAFVPPDGLWVRAAVVHDFLYRSSGRCIIAKVNRASSCSLSRPYQRAEADKILDDAMADIGIGMAARVTIWSGVRVGGHSGWSH